MKYWSLTSVAEYLGISRITLWKLRTNDESFPVPVKIQGKQLFDMEAVRRWENKRHAANKAENARRLRTFGGGK